MLQPHVDLTSTWLRRFSVSNEINRLFSTMGVQMKSNYPTMHLITVEFVREQYCEVKNV